MEPWVHPCRMLFPRKIQESIEFSQVAKQEIAISPAPWYPVLSPWDHPMDPIQGATAHGWTCHGCSVKFLWIHPRWGSRIRHPWDFENIIFRFYMATIPSSKRSHNCGKENHHAIFFDGKTQELLNMLGHFQ